MIKKSKEGITFNDTVYLTEENYRRFPIYMRLLQAFALFVGSYCFMTIFIRCFDLQFIKSYLIIAIVIFASVFFALLSYPKYDPIKLLLVFAVYGGLIFYRYNQLKNAFYILENAIIRKASDYYSFTEFSFIADYKTADRDITFLLIMIVIPMIGILALSILRNMGKIFCYIIMLIPIVVSFAMGEAPPEAYFIAYIMVFLFLSISNGFSYGKSSLLSSFGNVQKSMIHRIGVRSASVFCLLTLILFFIIKQLVPVEKYKDYNGIYEAKTKIQSFIMDFSIQDVSDRLGDVKWNIRPRRIEASGGLNLGELGRVDQVSYDETEHLRIRAPLYSKFEGLYLKGYIGSVYTGDSWRAHSKQIRKSYDKMMQNIVREDFEPAIGSSLLLSQNARRLFINQGRIEVRYAAANRDYVYAPYFTIFKERDRVSFDQDLAVVSDKNMEVGTYDYSYNISKITDYLDTDLTSWLGAILRDEEGRYIDADNMVTELLKYQENEKIYRDFVYETYTKLPEEGLDRLRHDFSRDEVGPASENIQDAIDYVKSYLNRTTRYTLSPGKLPKGKDFVEYFLYENKIGYCSHYASAGALMLRAMGYPSRYVEGYAINRSDLMNQAGTSYIGDESDTSEITVKDYNAHAWVEVYLDGFGWIPVEFTTGSEMEDMADAIDGFEQPGEKETEAEPSTPTDKPPHPTELPEEEVNPSPPAFNQDEDIKDSPILKDEDKKPQTRLGWYYVAALLLIFFAGIILYYISISKRNRLINEKCYSKRALILYKAIERLFILNHELPKRFKSLEGAEEYAKEHLTLVPVKDFDACMNTVRKARFGKASISLKEYAIVESFYNTLRNRIYEGLPPTRKVLFKIQQTIYIEAD